jgi:DNA (cytosine-5)-methyltransferase 1
MAGERGVHVWTYRSSEQAKATERSPDEPAPTMAVGHSYWPVWAETRPATTVQGDRRVQPPGHKMNSADPPGRYEGRDGKNAQIISIEEAAVLQGFPADYPWQGSQTSTFRQVGNAVPPPLARAVLAQVAGSSGWSW